MSMLSTAELTRMRADVARMLPDTASIYSRSESIDTAGNYTPGTTLVASVACRLDPKSNAGKPELKAGQETLVPQYMLTVPYNTTLDKNYTVVVNGKTYQIVELYNEHSWNVSRRALVAEVR